MINKKSYYSISEVSKMLNINEHTIRFWDSKMPELSIRTSKGKTRFFNMKQIEKLSKINDILKNNDSFEMALKIISKKISKKDELRFEKNLEFVSDSKIIIDKFKKIRNISNKLKELIS